MEPESNPQDYDQPVAYDINGQPLYAHPAVTPQPTPTPTTMAPSANTSRPEAMVASQAVHMTQPTEEEEPFISDSTRIKHDHSKQEFPDLHLGDGEYVIASIRRHPIGLLGPLGVGVLLIAIAFSILFNFDAVAQTFGLTGPAANPSNIILIVVLFVILVCIGTYVAYFVYTNNRFYLTNENVIEVSQLGMFTHREKSISLGSIEDASYTQNGFLQETVGYGSIQLSTMGDMTAYKFNYVFEPKQYIETLNNALEDFKNGRHTVMA